MSSIKPYVSVFTPSHDPTYLGEALASLQRQTFPDWEWIVLLNQGARWVPPILTRGCGWSPMTT
jgi:hypothetical protein